MRRTFVEDTNLDLLRILGERVISNDNPTMVLNRYIGEVETFLTKLQKLYAAGSADRNAIVEEAWQVLTEHMEATRKAIQELQTAEPEDVNEAMKEEQLMIFRISQNGAFGPLLNGGVAGVTERHGPRFVVRVEQNERNERLLEPFFSKPEWLFLGADSGATYHPGVVVRLDGLKRKIVLEFLADQKIPKAQVQNMARQQRKM